jgi:hypothetical protein
MKVYLGPKAKEHSWQNPFPEEAVCVHGECAGRARLAFVAIEDADVEDFVCNLYPNNGPGDFWLHDACAVAVYLCPKCLEPTAKYNQA